MFVLQSKSAIAAAAVACAVALSGLSQPVAAETTLTVSSWVPPTHFLHTQILVPYGEQIAKVTRSKGLIAGVHTDGPATAKKRFEQGYNFVTLMNDARALTVAATNMVKETRGESERVTAKTY